MFQPCFSWTLICVISNLCFCELPACLDSGVSLKRSGRHIWRKIQRLPDEGEDLPQNRRHSPACCITVVSLSSSRLKNIPPAWTKVRKPLWNVDSALCELWFSRHVSCFCSVMDTSIFCFLVTKEQHMRKMLIIMTQLLHSEDNK